MSTSCWGQATQPESQENSLLTELPTELLHTIFSYLSLQDVLRARKTCKTLAVVGLDYFGDEVPLVYQRDKPKALTEIAQHAVLSKRMHSLFYVVDRFRKTSFRRWCERRAKRRSPLLVEGCLAQNFPKHALRNAVEAGIATLAPKSQKRLRKGYRAFQALYRDQNVLGKDFYAYNCLHSLFVGCCNIREVTIVSKYHCDRQLGAERSAFKDAMVHLEEDKNWSDVGADQINILAHAVYRSGLKLDSLTIAGLSHTIFDNTTDRGKKLARALGIIVRPLRRLRLYIQAWSPEPNELDSDSDSGQDSGSDSDSDPDKHRAIREQSVAAFEHGSSTEVLAQARELRVLKLQLPRWDMYGLEPDYIRLDHVLRTIRFPHLCELALSQCEVTQSFFIDLLLRHKATLRRLTFDNMALPGLEDSWQEVLTRVSCQLPNLERVEFRGTLYEGEVMADIESYPGEDSNDLATYSVALEEFIIRGGEFPSVDDAMRALIERGQSAISDSDGDESQDDMSFHLSDYGDFPFHRPILDYELDQYDAWL